MRREDGRASRSGSGRAVRSVRSGLAVAIVLANAWLGRAATFVVDSVGDDNDEVPGDLTCADPAGRCTLRAALEESNLRFGFDSIVFSIPGAGVHRIRVRSELPDLTDHTGVGIDATSQPGYAGTPLIELDGGLAGNASGLRSTGGHFTLRGVAVHSFGVHGVVLRGSHLSFIEYCHVGTDASGSVALPNKLHGIYILDSSDNTISGNLLSGNLGDGIHVAGASAFSNDVIANRIGTDASGSLRLGNGTRGVTLNDAPRNFIGGPGPSGNLIAANGLYGIALEGPGATENVVAGNRVGTDASGTRALGNLRGILLDAAGRNTIGQIGAPNLVSGNLDSGIRVRMAAASGNLIAANWIGVQADGVSPLPNLRDGILVDGGAGPSTIGGDAPSGNLIAYNGRRGIAIEAGSGNRISGNRCFANDSLAIDLGNDLAVTPNDPLDADTGANELQNFPRLDAARAGCADVAVDGVLEAAPSASFTLELFVSTACDPSGHGQAERLLGTIQGSTDPSGLLRFSTSFPDVLRRGEVLTATATDAAGNTSELSACLAPGFDCGSCAVASLGRIRELRARKDADAVELSWIDDPAASEHHVNSVTSRFDLQDPRRGAPGVTAECEARTPPTSCRDRDAMSRAETLYYQALAACGPAGSDEGPH